MNEGVHRNHFSDQFGTHVWEGRRSGLPDTRVMTGAFAFLVGRMVTHAWAHERLWL